MLGLRVSTAFVIVLALGTCASAAQVTLKSLLAADNQEVAGDDEIKIVITVDGEKQEKTLNNPKMKRGSTWSLDEKVTFTSALKVEVFETDPNSEQLLGTVEIKKAGKGEQTLAGGSGLQQYKYVLKWE